jgi:putative transposase
MPRGLERRYQTQSSHFITCSCYHRLPYLNDNPIKQAFLSILEELRAEYRFRVYGYVLMPEHFHLLISKPDVGDPSIMLQILKQRVARRGLRSMTRTVSPPTLSQKMGKDGAPAVLGGKGTERQFWQRRFYDFNVCTREKHVEKLRYMHRNPVKRGLVREPRDWPWSSFRHYAFREMG